MNLAADNFLIPNGTFLACLLIFAIVLIVIKTTVVPPITKVLEERQARVARTAEDNRAAAASFEDADTEYRAAMQEARADATGIRDEARAKANEELAEAKRRATEEADATLAETTKALKVEGDSAMESARRDVDRLSGTLAGRVLGTDVKAAKAVQTETVN